MAASATSPTPPVTPAAGNRGQEQPADGGQRAGQRPRAGSHPVQPDAHEGGGLAVLRRRSHGDAPVGQLHHRRERGHEDERDGPRDHARLRDADARDLDHVVAPRRADADDVRADLARQLGEQQDVDAERQDRQGAEVGAADAADQQHVNERRDERRREDPGEHGGPEADRAVEASDHVRPEQQQGALREVDHPRGAEDRHEAERHERVDRAQEQTADQQADELAHAAPPR
jgi:hypothetical protein